MEEHLHKQYHSPSLVYFNLYESFLLQQKHPIPVRVFEKIQQQLYGK